MNTTFTVINNRTGTSSTYSAAMVYVNHDGLVTALAQALGHWEGRPANEIKSELLETEGFALRLLRGVHAADTFDYPPTLTLFNWLVCESLTMGELETENEEAAAAITEYNATLNY